MCEEFEGNIPEIEIRKVGNTFFYKCKDTGESLMCPCDIVSKKCYDCIGLNSSFHHFYHSNKLCSCGDEVDFGYFIIIYCLEKAGMLTKDFKIQCCGCKRREKKQWEEDTKR